MEAPDREKQAPGDVATVAFIDLAGFSAITDVYGDESAVKLVTLFEEFVADAVEGHAPPVKWMGDEVMLAFPEPKAALGAMGRLLTACRQEPRLPLTRTAVHHGPVVRRRGDLFGSTVNIAARVVALAGPGQMLATETIALLAEAEGISTRALGQTAIRSLVATIPIYEVHIAPAPDPIWIDPVCKMLAPFATFRRDAPDKPWFCSDKCAEAYARSPHTYPWVGTSQQLGVRTSVRQAASDQDTLMFQTDGPDSR